MCSSDLAQTVGLQVTSVVKAGDFVDQMIQEIGALASIIKLGRLTQLLLRTAAPLMRTLSNTDLMESGGLGIYVHLSKISSDSPS